MPIYEYVCADCQEKAEIIQKFGESTPAICPNCQAEGTLHKAVAKSAFHLKGGGWYKDLYSSSKDKPAKSTESSSSKAEVAKKEDKVEKDKKDD